MTHLMLIAAFWGYLASWLNEFIKQDGWSKLVNTLIADAVLVITAALVTLSSIPGNGDFHAHDFWQALLMVGASALLNHTFFLNPTGVGPAIQTATSINKSGPA